jgi:hypothetical protein
MLFKKPIGENPALKIAHKFAREQKSNAKSDAEAMRRLLLLVMSLLIVAAGLYLLVAVLLWAIDGQRVPIGEELKAGATTFAKAY